MLTCNDANVLIVRTIDDALSGQERAALRRHLVSCARCRAEYETQHEVRRLLVLHIQDRLPAGFDERLRARLAQASRPLFGAMPRDTRRTWALRLIPLAATLMLIVAGTSVRETSPQPAVLAQPAAGPGQPRAFTTVVPPRDARAPRSHRSSRSPVAADDVAFAPASPPAEEGERQGIGAVAIQGAASEHASRTANVVLQTSDTGARVPPSESRERERERVAGSENAAGGELAASQRPGILPRPSVPVPHARPAMPAPPAVMPDRTIPPQ